MAVRLSKGVVQRLLLCCTRSVALEVVWCFLFYGRGNRHFGNLQSLCNQVVGLFVPLPSKSQTCKSLGLQPGTHRTVHAEQKILVVFMWAGFGNALHAYIHMVVCFFFFAAAAD